MAHAVVRGQNSQQLLLFLQGGLGNQLMQYVLAKTLAQHTKKQLIVSKTLLASRTRRWRGLTSRSISPLLEHRLSWKRDQCHHQAWSRLSARLPDRLNSHVITDRVLAKAAHAPNPIDELLDRTLIHTHATHPLIFETFFHDCWCDILTQLGHYLRQPTSDIVLHVRRADYLKSSSGFLVLTEEYYRTAIDLATSVLGAVGRSIQIDVFTDDPAWCHSRLRDSRWTLRINKGSPEQDLASMAHAGLLITANSSLSAVAAHLAQIHNPQAIILTPDKWLRVVDGQLGDLRKSSWIAVKC
jgi:hypothetical protein